MNKYKVLLLRSVQDFIATLNEEDRGKVKCMGDSMELGNFDSLYIKTLETPIKELIIKNYRFIFFINKNEIYKYNYFKFKDKCKIYRFIIFFILLVAEHCG